MSVVFIVMVPMNEDLVEYLVWFKFGSLQISGTALCQEFKVRIMRGMQILILVWVLLGNGFMGLLDVMEESVVEARDTDSWLARRGWSLAYVTLPTYGV